VWQEKRSRGVSTAQDPEQFTRHGTAGMLSCRFRMTTSLF
jgi:hypothetical protein